MWAEAIRGYVEHLGSEGLEAALGGEVRWLGPLLPDHALRGLERVSAPAGVARERLADVLVRVLDSFERPPVVVLDDMQWAYPESLELFGQVARLGTGSPMIVCCRGTGLDLGHPLAQRLAEVHRLRSCEYLSLGPLSRREARELLEQAAGGTLEARLVDAVYEESARNPFFLGELGRHLHREGGTSLARGGGRALPESIRWAVGLRLAGLSAQTRQVLQLASVFTGGFGFVELQVLTELEEGSLLDCVEQALAEELVRPVDGERYDFAHALVRQTLYESLSPSRRARLHRRLAEALVRLHENDREQVAAELVRQYHASATLPGAERGASHALTAARAARVAGAPGDAVMILGLGLDLVAAEDTGMRARVLGELALADAEAGLYEDATRTLEAAVSLLEHDGAPDEAIAELVYTVGVTFAFAVALQSVEAIEPLVARGLAAFGQTRNLAWARLKLLYRFARPEAAGPVRVLRPVRFDSEAVRIARSEGTEADYAFTIESWDPSFRGEVEQLISRIKAWQDPVARLRALLRVMGYLTLTEPGSSPAADRLCVELRALADDVGLVPDRAFARVFRAALLGGRGEFDAAAEQIGQARALFEPGQPPEMLDRARAGLVAIGGPVFPTFTTFSWIAHFVEVRVEATTRRIRVPTVVSVADCGRVASPVTAASQVRGGVVWGIGAALQEESEVDPRFGGFFNTTLEQYPVPVNADVQQIDVDFIDKPDLLFNDVGVKGVGELALVGVAAAIANAVFHATGRRHHRLPIRLEHVLL